MNVYTVFYWQVADGTPDSHEWFGLQHLGSEVALLHRSLPIAQYLPLLQVEEEDGIIGT